MTIDVRLPDGTVAHFPDGMTNDAIDRALREHAAKGGGDTGAPVTPEVPSSEAEKRGLPASSYKPDPSELDTWGAWTDKQIKSGLRGTALGFGDFADFIWNKGIRNPGRILYNDINYGLGGDPANYYSDEETRAYDPNVRSAIESNIIPQPEGKGYENTADVSEIFGPAAVEAILTSGASLPESVAAAGPGTLRRALVLPKAATRAAVKTVRDVGLGVGGGELGGGIGRAAFGETGGDLGTILSAGLTSSYAPTAAEWALSKATTGPMSKARLAAIDAANANLPADRQIPVSMGLVGRKNIGTLEDISGRTPFSTRPEDVRRQQFEGMEQGIRSTLDTARGGPAAGQITASSIGTEAKDAIARADARAGGRVSRIQNQLESAVGSQAPTMLTNTFNTLRNVAANRMGVGHGVRQQAVDLLVALRKNLGSRTATTPSGQKVNIVTPAGYGALKDERSGLGKKLDRQGQGLSKGLQKRAYKGMTEDMRQTAQAQGVNPADFDIAQAETKRLSSQQDILKKLSPENATETEVYNRTVGKDNPSRLSPLLEHTPDQLVKLAVDDLELRLRDVSAGQPINPDIFNPATFLRWRAMSPQRKALIARNNPDVISRMDTLAEVGLAEEARGGKRTRPGRTGSTIAGLNLGLGALFGAGGYFGPHGGILPALGGAAFGLGLPYMAGRVLTNPAFARRMVNPEVPGLAQVLSRAVGGTAASTNVQTDPLTQQRQREEDLRQRHLRGIQ